MNHRHIRWPQLRPPLSHFTVHVLNCDQCAQTINLDDPIGMCSEGVFLLRELIELLIAIEKP